MRNYGKNIVDQFLLFYEPKLYHFTIELYRRTMEGKQENLDSTAGFINYKCKKDHLTQSPLRPIKKTNSLYHSDFKNKPNPKAFNDSSNMVGKERNSVAKIDVKHVGGMGSSYRASFENHQSPKPVRMKEKSSFFLKHQNYEPPTSTYNRMSIINKRGGEFSIYEKAKPRSDNLTIAKYNRMNSNSVYKMQFQTPLKLPQIFERKDSMNSQSSKQSYHKHKISKIF